MSVVSSHCVVFVQLTEAQREEMRRYRHCAVMLESKLRASAQQKKLVQLQTAVQEINVGMYCDSSVGVIFVV